MYPIRLFCSKRKRARIKTILLAFFVSLVDLRAFYLFLLFISTFAYVLQIKINIHAYQLSYDPKFYKFFFVLIDIKFSYLFTKLVN